MGPGADDEDVAKRLRAEALEQSGRGYRALAGRLSGVSCEGYPVVRGHRESVTTVVVSDDGAVAYSASKDGTIVKWDVATGARLHTFPAFTRRSGKGRAHTARVLALALTSDGRLLASGGEDRRVHLWDTSAITSALTSSESDLGGHRDSITALAFRGGSRQLFSGSADRTVKVWNADSGAYVETLYGHQADVTALDCLDRERVLSAGGADCTCRVWKIPEESQLVYRAHAAPVDTVALLSESAFIAGSQDGAVSLWLASKKAPVDYRKNAHGSAWVAAVAACKRSDLAASGASDGRIRLWRLDRRAGDADAAGAPLLPVLRPLRDIRAVGFVNGLAFAKNGSVLVAGLGQEHRLGRWTRIPQASNGVSFIPLAYTDDVEDIDSEV